MPVTSMVSMVMFCEFSCTPPKFPEGGKAPFGNQSFPDLPSTFHPNKAAHRLCNSQTIRVINPHVIVRAIKHRWITADSRTMIYPIIAIRSPVCHHLTAYRAALRIGLPERQVHHETFLE